MKKQISMILSAAIIGGLVAVGAQQFFTETETSNLMKPEKIQQGSNYTSQTSMNALVPAGVDFTVAAERTTSGVVHIKTYRLSLIHI